MRRKVSLQNRLHENTQTKKKGKGKKTISYHFGDICQFPQLAYNDFDSHLDQFKPLTPKGAYLGKCPNCPCGSGIMVATERQI